MHPGDHEFVPRLPAVGERTPSALSLPAIFSSPKPSRYQPKILRTTFASLSSTTATV